MKQLDPKAVWLFFFTFLLQWMFALLVIFIFFWNLLFSNTPIGFLPKEEGFTFISGPFWWLGPLAILGLLFIASKLTYKFYKYELREDSFRKEHGIIWKKYVSIPYDRIQNVDIYRGIVARILGLSDIQIQTAGGITKASYGAFSEGRLLGLPKETAEQLRDELILRARQSKNQGV